MVLPVHGPYHAAHLHPSLNTEEILHVKDSRVQEVLGNLKPRFPIMSCTSYTWYAEHDSILLIQAVVRDILTQPLQFQEVLHGCVLTARNFSGPKCLVIPFG